MLLYLLTTGPGTYQVQDIVSSEMVLVLGCSGGRNLRTSEALWSEWFFLQLGTPRPTVTRAVCGFEL